MRPGVSVVVASLGAPRRYDLFATLRSVCQQTRFPDAIHVAIDSNREGAWSARSRALNAVDTAWTAYIDDDDLMFPQHLERLLACADETGADVVYPWFHLEHPDLPPTAGDSILQTVKDGELVSPFGVDFGPEQADHLRINNFIPVTMLVRTELAQAAGFPQPHPCSDISQHQWHHPDEQEEWGHQLRLLDLGARFVHLPERTWVWRHHGRNTSGKPFHAAELYERVD